MRYILHIVFILCCSTVFGQDSQASDTVVLFVRPTVVHVGNPFEIKIKSKVKGEFDLNNLPPSFIISTQSTSMQSSVNNVTGNIDVVYYFNITATCQEVGTYTIGPASIETKDGLYTSNSVDISIGEKSNVSPTELSEEQMKSKAFGIIQVNKTSIYEGEPVVISANIYSYSQPRFVSNYTSYSIEGGCYKHSLALNNGIKLKRDRINEVDVFSFNYDENIVFPIGKGDLEINPFSAILNFGTESSSFISDIPQITIKPLPSNPPADFCNAVGKFTVENRLETGEYNQGDIFKLQIIVTGQGNLMSVNCPKLILPEGFVLYDSNTEEDYSYSLNGTEGSLTFEYFVMALQSGDFVLPTTSLSYFDLVTKQYRTLATRELNLSIGETKGFDPQAVYNEIKAKNAPSEMNLYLVMDVSNSMLAKDFKPNRLEAVKNAAKGFVEQSEGDGIGLVLFAGESVSQCSKTIDHKKLILEIDQANGDSIIGGTAIGDALLMAIKQLDIDNAFSKVIILMSDGTNNSGTATSSLGANLAFSKDIRIYTIGVAGSGIASSPVMTPNGIEYQELNIEFDEKDLKEVADITDGKYFRARNEADLYPIFAEIKNIENSKRRK